MYVSGDAVRQFDIAETFHWKWRQLEEDMVTWWLRLSEEQTQLRTTGDAHLIVINAGQLNDGPGPDVLNCHLFLDDLEMTGDIEMHIKGGDWYHHQHHHDPVYENVILHVVKEVGVAPDIPTLILPQFSLGRKFCPARRAVSENELDQIAEVRFREKVNHIERLARNELGLSPLLLGIFEVLLAGPQRTHRLQELALYLGLRAWPHAREWKGSRQAFIRNYAPSKKIELILSNQAAFDSSKWDSINCKSWFEWDQHLSLLTCLGISANQAREWVVNILASFKAECGGFSIWQDLKSFRSYGHERQLCDNLGLKKMGPIIVQQAGLEWKKQFCSSGDCSICPLVRSY